MVVSAPVSIVIRIARCMTWFTLLKPSPRRRQSNQTRAIVIIASHAILQASHTVTSGSSKDALETSRNFADSIPAYHAARHDALAVYIISQSEIQGNEQEGTNSSDQAQETKVKKFVALCEDPDAPRK